MAQFNLTVHMIDGPDLLVDPVEEEKVVMLYELLGEKFGGRLKLPSNGVMYLLPASRVHYVTATQIEETSK